MQDLEQLADHLPQARPVRHEDGPPAREGRAQLRTGFRPRMTSPGASPTRSTAILGACTSTSSTFRPRRISSAVAPSAIHPRPASSTRINGYTGIPGLHVIDGSTIAANLGVNPALTITAHRNGLSRSGPTRANPTHVLHSAPLISGFRRSRRAIRSCPKTRRRRFAYQRSDSAANLGAVPHGGPCWVTEGRP